MLRGMVDPEGSGRYKLHGNWACFLTIPDGDVVRGRVSVRHPPLQVELLFSVDLSGYFIANIYHGTAETDEHVKHPQYGITSLPYEYLSLNVLGRRVHIVGAFAPGNSGWL